MGGYHCILLLILLSTACVYASAQDEWQTQDAFDEIREKMEEIADYNCDSASLESLFLPEDAVSHYPNVDYINVNRNEKDLVYLHNIAMTRSFFWSYILQTHAKHPTVKETYDPGMVYYFLSSVADLATNPLVSASSIYFSPNMAYTSSYTDYFNKTLRRYAPRATRISDFKPVHIQKISSQNFFEVKDLGSFASKNLYDDYTSDEYRINEWYQLWLTDKNETRNDSTTEYQIEIRYSDHTNKTFTFYGPPRSNEAPGPVKWTRPYFDCNRLNKWLVAAVSPVVDVYPRHTQIRDIEHPTYTAAVVLEMDYDKIDIDQCPPKPGNNKSNRFASTARCKLNTTECESIHGLGFQRGGYQCRCRPGFHLPATVRQSYLGEAIESVDSNQYANNFDCLQNGPVTRLPERGKRTPPSIRSLYTNRFDEYVKVVRGLSALQQERINVHEVINFIKSVQQRNCHRYHGADLVLDKSVAYGAEVQFENQARMAVRLANFISAFLQISDPQDVFSGNQVADKELTEDQMFGETLAIMFSDSKILSAGIFWDRNKFSNRTFFAPLAYKTDLNSWNFKIEDLAGFDKPENAYTHKSWFLTLKQRWGTSYDNLEQFYVKINMRNNEQGETLKKFNRYPTQYRAANLEHGHWSTPYFDCDGYLNQWVITFASPFFGWDSTKTKLEFKGVVAVSMPLPYLDINQCANEYHEQNIFKNTNKCDTESTQCVPIPGRGFEAGGYKCECRQGYEFPYDDQNSYFDGKVVEAEFQNIIRNKETRIHLLKCRSLSAPSNETTAQN